MVQSKWVTQVILTEDLWRGLHEASERLSGLHGERWSASAVARQCITMALPVMLNTIEERAAWLDERTPISALRSLLGPAPDALLNARRVSRAVSNARNEGPQLIDEIPDESVGLGL